MSFIDQIITGHRSVLRTLSLIWLKPVLNFYNILHSLVNMLLFLISSLVLGLGVFGIYHLLQGWFKTLFISETVYFGIFLSLLLVVSLWIKLVFETALLRRVMNLLHRKELTFSQSFDFDKGLGKKLFTWSLIIILFVGAVIFVGGYFSLFVYYYCPYIVIFLAFLSSWFVLPILIKRNFDLVKAIKQSFELTWKHFIELISALISLIFYMLIIGFVVGTVVFGLTWLVCYILLIPFSIGLIMPFVLIGVIPIVLLGIYFGTVIMALPGVLYHSIIDKLK